MPPVVDYSRTTLNEDLKKILLNKNHPVIFDIGANIGQSIAEFKRYFPACTIYSFEPGPTTFLELKRNNSGKKGVHLENLAVASNNGKKEFLENESSDMSSFLEYNHTEWGRFKKKTIVDAITLDDYCKKNHINKIDILKIDTQGYELEVFKGSLRLMKENNIQLLYFEFIFSDMYKDLPSFGDLYNLLIENNFKLVKFYESHYQNGLLSWIDVLFINSDYSKS